MVRDESRLDRDGAPVEVVRADAFQPAPVAKAIAGSDVVVSAVGHAGHLDDRSFYVRAAESLVAAARTLDANRPRLIVVGGFGSLRDASGAQLADVASYPATATAEIVGQRDALTFYRTVKDVQWTYFSPPPGGIWPGDRTGSYRTTRDGVPDGDLKAARVSLQDFAAAVLDEAERGEHVFACVVATT